MNRLLPPSAALLLLGSLPFAPTSASAQAVPDLTVAIAQPDDPARYAVYETTVTLANEGTAPATGVTVRVPRPEGVVYEGGNESVASQGRFTTFGERRGRWNVGTLAPGATATLTVRNYLLAPTAPVGYAEVLTQNGPDADSTPGNGTPPTVNEDDEASTALGTGGGDGATADLSVTLSRPGDPPAFSNYSLTVAVRNDGPAVATGVVVSVPFDQGAGAVFTGGDEFDASQGTYSPYGRQRWTVGTLAPGAEATLALKLYRLRGDLPARYAQVVASDQDDPDSTPGNGTPPTVNEDDEASTADPSGGDDELTNLTAGLLYFPSDPATATGTIQYRYEFNNATLAPVTERFAVIAYVSDDRTLSADDLPVDTTFYDGFPATKGLREVDGQFSRAGIAPGDYTLILKVDATEAVAESDETDNVVRDEFTLSDLDAPCNIAVEVLGVDCDDAGTPSDPADDEYAVEVLVTNDGATGTWEYTVPSFRGGLIVLARGTYGEPLVVDAGRISGSGRITTFFTARDSVNPTCQTSFDLEDFRPATCSPGGAGPDADPTCGFASTFPFDLFSSTSELDQLAAEQTEQGFRVSSALSFPANRVFGEVSAGGEELIASGRDGQRNGVVALLANNAFAIAAQPSPASVTITAYDGFGERTGSATTFDLAGALGGSDWELQSFRGSREAGFALSGRFLPAGASRTENFVVLLDARGFTVTGSVALPQNLPGADAGNSLVRDVAPDGTALVSFTELLAEGQFRTGFSTVAVSPAGRTLWRNGPLGFRSSGGRGGFTPDGAAVYTTYSNSGDGLGGVLRKTDAATGEVLFELLLGGLAGEGFDASAAIPGATLALADGGSVTTFGVRGSGGDLARFAARLDAAGDVVWLRDNGEVTENSSGGIPVLETADGGVLIVNGRGPGSTQLVLLNADGNLDEDCEPAGGGDEGFYDLELSATSADPTPARFAVNEVTYTVINAGNRQVRGPISVFVDLPQGTVYEGGNEFAATAGDFAPLPFGDGEWTFSGLVPGASESITVRYYAREAGGYVAYAEVVQAEPFTDIDDPDSTPGNGDGATAREDDEVALDLRYGPAASRGALTVTPTTTTIGAAVSVQLHGVTVAGRTELIVSDLSGRTALRRAIDLLAGDNLVEFGTRALTPGVYVVSAPGAEAAPVRLVVR